MASPRRLIGLHVLGTYIILQYHTNTFYFSLTFFDLWDQHIVSVKVAVSRWSGAASAMLTLLPERENGLGRSPTLVFTFPIHEYGRTVKRHRLPADHESLRKPWTTVSHSSAARTRSQMISAALRRLGRAAPGRILCLNILTYDPAGIFALRAHGTLFGISQLETADELLPVRGLGPERHGFEGIGITLFGWREKVCIEPLAANHGVQSSETAIRSKHLRARRGISRQGWRQIT